MPIDMNIAAIIIKEMTADMNLIFVSNLKSYRFIKDALNKGPD